MGERSHRRNHRRSIVWIFDSQHLEAVDDFNRSSRERSADTEFRDQSSVTEFVVSTAQGHQLKAPFGRKGEAFEIKNLRWMRKNATLCQNSFYGLSPTSDRHDAMRRLKALYRGEGARKNCRNSCLGCSARECNLIDSLDRICVCVPRKRDLCGSPVSLNDSS